MGFTALHMLWLLPALTLTTQGLVNLSVSPKITAECGKPVTLNCNASSSQRGLSIKHMEWSQDKATLCSVDTEGEITHHRDSLSDFHCEYEYGRLSLIFQKMQPLKSGNSKPYRCKQHSNQGTAHGYTRVELQECCGKVEAALTSSGPTCTFSHVCPDGDVDWFHGSHNLSDESLKISTYKSVDRQGGLTIQSYLWWNSSNVPYNCSLRSTISGRYIASALVLNRAVPIRSGAGSQEIMRKIVCVLISLAITLK
ncbi:uncharacterized protein [Brachyistius frenatus]|uniref:uncharacterized protein n=1 Tax=Brachyistius frenatus TaxID=100188 RepID=UPI0037E783B4